MNRRNRFGQGRAMTALLLHHAATPHHSSGRFPWIRSPSEQVPDESQNPWTNQDGAPLLPGSVSGSPVPPIRSAPSISRSPSLCPYARR
jgi:hypothetical protein